MKKKIKEAIIVEGRDDTAAIGKAVDAVTIETHGFGMPDHIWPVIDKAYTEKGIIVFTDPDGAGFVIRNHIKSAIPAKYLKHAYIPDIAGKEKRKAAPGKEGKLGVEGMKPETILEALRRAGATIEGEDIPQTQAISKQDMMDLGLSGGADASAKRLALLKKLNLPEHMSANALLQALNLLYSLEELERIVSEI